MKFKDLAELSSKDAEKNLNVETIKSEYLSKVAEQNKSIQSLKRILENKFNSELKAILEMNQEIQYQEENGSFDIQFGGGNILIEIKPAINNGDGYSVKKKILMKRGEKSDFVYIELSPNFPFQHNNSILETYVDLISKGTVLSIQQITAIKSEQKQIEKNIEVMGSSLQYIYYVYQQSKLGNGKVNESEDLEEMLDRAISWTTIFK